MHALKGMSNEPEFSIHQMRVFKSIVRHGSMSAAASALSLPQPSVSRLVGRIEATAGIHLFARTTGGVSLTEAGKVFLQNAERVLHFHDLAYAELQDIRGKLVGEVRIAAPESVSDNLFAPLIKQFQETHPDAAIRTVAASSASIPPMLDAGAVDIGIIANTHPPPGGTPEDLCTEKFFLIGTEHSPEIIRPKIPLAKAAKLPLILNAMPGGFRTLIDKAFDTLGENPIARIEIDANAPLLDLILEGEGFSIMPYSIIAQKRQRLGLAAAEIVEPTITRKLSLYIARRRPMTPLIREAARQVKAVMSAHAPGARWSMIDS